MKTLALIFTFALLTGCGGGKSDPNAFTLKMGSGKSSVKVVRKANATATLKEMKVAVTPVLKKKKSRVALYYRRQSRVRLTSVCYGTISEVGRETLIGKPIKGKHPAHFYLLCLSSKIVFAK